MVYCALFSAGFVIWLQTAKKYASKDELTFRLNRLIDDIAENAEVWIEAKIQKALQIAESNIKIHSAVVIKFHLSAMFNEAIMMITERKFEPEAARSHACYIHLSKNLQRLALMGELPMSEIQNILQKGIESTDAIAQELTEA